MFGPQRSQKIYAHYRQTVPAGSDINRGSSSTLGVDSTFGGVRPSLGRRHGRRISTSKEDVSTAPAGVSSRNPARADGSTGHSVASASCPPRTSARPVASATQLRRRSRQVDDPARFRPIKSSFRANSASVCADTATSGFGSSKSGRGFL